MEIDKKIETPYFVVSQEILNKNIEDFQLALQCVWPNSHLAYSVKTNSLPWLLKYILQKNILAEVVSDEEYLLAKKCGFSTDKIVFNGPIKGERCFKDAMSFKAYVNIDSENELKYLDGYFGFKDVNLGLRVNVDSNIFSEEDVGYKNDGFRFGFAEENGEFAKALEKIHKIFGDCSIGLHFHCNSNSRSLAVYKAIAQYAAKLIVKYELEPSFIDIGGGFFGGVEGKPTPMEYLRVIADELTQVVDSCKTKLIVEPGSAIIGSAIELVTSVIDVKDTSKARIITTDGSRIHIDPLWKKTKYMYSLQTKYSSHKFNRQIVCGYTCMDHDRIMILEDEKELNVGDQIIYQRVGAYTLTFGGMFIRYLPDVYLNKDNKLEKIRTRISIEDYYKIQS